MLFGLFYSPASAYSSFSMPILSFMPILPLILHLMPIPTLPPPTPPPQFPTSSAFPSSSSTPTSSALSNPIPELILALLGSAMRLGSSWRRLVLLFVLVRLGTTWTCYSSRLILAMICLLFVLAGLGTALFSATLQILFNTPHSRQFVSDTVKVSEPPPACNPR